MNKVFLIGMATVVAFQMSVAQAAGVVHVADVKSKMETDMKDANKRGAIRGLDESSAIAQLNSVAKNLKDVSKTDYTSEWRLALAKRIKTSDLGEINVMDIARKILKTRQSLDEIQAADLDAAGKAQYDTLKNAVDVSAQFLSLASTSSDINLHLDAQSQKEIDAFNKQLSLIPEMLTKMDTKELQSHLDIMTSAIASRNSPEMTGDKAYAAALKTKYGSGFDKKLEEILGCSRAI